VDTSSPVDTLFEGSNDRYYTEWQVQKRLRNGEWKLCIRQQSPDRQLVGTGDGALLLLVPIDATALPAWAEIRIDGRGSRVVDTRHTGSW